MRWAKILPVVLMVLVIAGQNRALADGWLGVGLRPLTRQETDRLGWDSPRGAYVTATAIGGDTTPAQRAGMEVGDIVVSIDGIEISGPDYLVNVIKSKSPETVVAIGVRRAGQERRIMVALGERPCISLYKQSETTRHFHNKHCSGLKYHSRLSECIASAKTSLKIHKEILAQRCPEYDMRIVQKIVDLDKGRLSTLYPDARRSGGRSGRRSGGQSGASPGICPAWAPVPCAGGCCTPIHH